MRAPVPIHAIFFAKIAFAIFFPNATLWLPT
jgi:hypothetical protein